MSGQRVGSYEIVRVLARGGMAVVYLARQPALDREVARRLPSGAGQFGRRLVAGDFDRAGFADLAVGAPGDGSAAPGTGAVVIVFGHRAGLRAAQARTIERPDETFADFGRRGASRRRRGQALATAPAR